MVQEIEKSDTRRKILEAARKVFVDVGYSRFTLRKVATLAGISLGNINYYFRRKDDLLTALLEHVIAGYLVEFDRRRVAAGTSPEKQLEAVLEYWLDDLLTLDTTVFFPELWALSNHDQQVAAMTDRLYQLAREPLVSLIPEINPTLTSEEVARLALVMCASMEGLTVFAGYKKPWAAQHAALKQTMIRSFLRMIRG